MNAIAKKQREAVDEELRLYDAAIDKARETNEARARKIKGAADKLRQIVADLNANKDDVIKARNEAIIDGDAVREAKLDADLKDIEREIREAELKIEALDRTDPSQVEKESVLQTVAHYRGVKEACGGALADLAAEQERIEREIERLGAELEDVKSAAQRVATIKNNGGKSHHFAILVRAYESAFGPINVSGHFCASENEAKERFLAGSSRGIENTPAYKNGIEEA